MTGYGRGVADDDGFRAIVEIRAVNHRFLDLKLRGSTLAPAVEERVCNAIREVCQRGSVTAVIRVESRGARAVMRVDLDAARRAHAELSRLAELLHDERDPEGRPRIPIELLCAQPGVLVPQDPEQGAAESARRVEAAVSQALAQLTHMRDTEGARLAADVGARRERLGQIVAALERDSARQPADIQARLAERITRLLKKTHLELDRDRLLQEVALCADRVDVTEELVRLRSHLEQVDELMTRAGPIGRRLEFLIQEMAREFNTIASKSQSPDISRRVVDARAELEKVREQVQNIE